MQFSLSGHGQLQACAAWMLAQSQHACADLVPSGYCAGPHNLELEEPTAAVPSSSSSSSPSDSSSSESSSSEFTSSSSLSSLSSPPMLPRGSAAPLELSDSSPRAPHQVLVGGLRNQQVPGVLALVSSGALAGPPLRPAAPRGSTSCLFVSANQHFGSGVITGALRLPEPGCDPAADIARAIQEGNDRGRGVAAIPARCPSSTARCPASMEADDCTWLIPEFITTMTA
jgi:hypothetical protein